MIFTGSQHLEQRRREYWKILGKSIYKTVSYLEREDAINLIRQPVEGREHGFGFLPFVAVDPHFNQRGRHTDLTALRRRP